MILVTGSEGFLGRSVCARLYADKQEFAAVDLRSAEPCDIGDSEAVERLFDRHPIEKMIHLAAMLPSACSRNPAQAHRVNVAGSACLLETAARHGVRRFVFGSSISAYDPRDTYAAGKQYIENYGCTLSASTTISFVALRIATVVGAGARFTASPWRSEIFEKLGTGERQTVRIPYRPDTMLSLVHVEDAARMLVLLTNREKIPSPLYDTPAENWRMGDLKSTLESLDQQLTVELDEKYDGTPPLAHGAGFVVDFGWQSPPFADRLAACLLE